MQNYLLSATNLFYASRVLAFSLVITFLAFDLMAVQASELEVSPPQRQERARKFIASLMSNPTPLDSNALQSSEVHEPIFYYELGLAYHRATKYEQAVAAFQQAILLKPDFAEAYNNLGSSYYSLGEHRKAHEVIRQAILLKPKMAVAFSNLGNVNIALGHNKQAIPLFEQALRLGLNDEVTHCSLGVAYYRAKRYKEAAERFRRAICLKADYAVAHFNLGATYWTLKNKELALDQHAWLKAASPDLAEELFDGFYRKGLLVVTQR